MDASLSNLFKSRPNDTATLWGYLDTLVALMLIPSSIAILTRLRFANLTAICLATLACSIYAAQEALILTDKYSDQTYILLNSHLKDFNPILPLIVGIFALTISILRLKNYQILPR